MAHHSIRGEMFKAHPSRINSRHYQTSVTLLRPDHSHHHQSLVKLPHPRLFLTNTLRPSQHPEPQQSPGKESRLTSQSLHDISSLISNSDLLNLLNLHDLSQTHQVLNLRKHLSLHNPKSLRKLLVLLGQRQLLRLQSL